MGIVSKRLADFAVNVFQDPPCCHLRSKGFRFSRAVAIARGKFRFAQSASSVWPVLGSWLLHTRRRLLNLPHPPTVPGLKTSGSTKRSFFRTRFLSPILTRWLFRSSVCISCPNRSHKDRCVRFFALPGDMTFSLRQVLPLSFGALARNIRNRCHACSDAEDQFFSAFRIDTVLVRTHFWIRIVLVS